MRTGSIMLSIPLGGLICSLLMAQPPDYRGEIAYLKSAGRAPAEYVAGKFATHDIVFLGEDHGIRQNLEFVAGLIPVLYNAGVTNLGMEFGASEMQARLDSLITGNRYDESTARDMMFFYNAGWAYKEYMEVYRAAWRFNSSLAPGVKRFRVLNLSYRFTWQGFDGKRTPEAMAKVFRKGPPDEYRARIIEEQVVARHEKVLLLVGAPHAYTRYRSARYRETFTDTCSYDSDWLGNRLYARHPEKIFTILLHTPFNPINDTTNRLVYPANGAFRKILEGVGGKPVGFDLVDSPIGSLPDSSSYSVCHPHFTMGQMFDGYLVLCPFRNMEGCTIDTLFFQDRSWEEIRSNMPDPDWHPKRENLGQFWEQITGFVDIPRRYSHLSE